MRTRCVPPYRSVIALTMAVVMLMASLPVNLAHAAMVTTDQVIEQSNSADNRARVMDFMAREGVRRELGTLGIDPDEAARRVASLSNEEIRRIAGRLDDLPAGQQAYGPDLIVAGLVVTVVGFLILFFIVGWFIWDDLFLTAHDSSSEQVLG